MSMNKFIVDDMFLTTDMPTTAGSKMLEGYNSLFEAEALTRLKAAGYSMAGKTKVGEFGADLLGETCYFGADYENDVLQYPAVLAVKSGQADAAVVLEQRTHTGQWTDMLRAEVQHRQVLLR